MRLTIIGGICPICNETVWYKPKRVMTRPVLGMVGDSMRLIHRQCYLTTTKSKGEKEHEKERNNK